MLFACIYVPNFLAQAAVRLDPRAAASSFAVVAGNPPQVRVVALNAKAVKRGLWIGMTRMEAEASTGIRIFERSSKLEASAHAALLDCASRFSPRCEDVSDETLVLDISGLSKLLGTPAQIAKAIREQARRLSLYIRIGVSRNIDSAIHGGAGTTESISVLPSGKEGDLLKDAPLSILDPSPETYSSHLTCPWQYLPAEAGVSLVNWTRRMRDEEEPVHGRADHRDSDAG